MHQKVSKFLGNTYLKSAVTIKKPLGLAFVITAKSLMDDNRVFISCRPKLVRFLFWRGLFLNIKFHNVWLEACWKKLSKLRPSFYSIFLKELIALTVMRPRGLSPKRSPQSCPLLLHLAGNEGTRWPSDVMLAVSRIHCYQRYVVLCNEMRILIQVSLLVAQGLLVLHYTELRVCVAGEENFQCVHMKGLLVLSGLDLAVTADFFCYQSGNAGSMYPPRCSGRYWTCFIRIVEWFQKFWLLWGACPTEQALMLIYLFLWH